MSKGGLHPQSGEGELGEAGTMWIATGARTALVVPQGGGPLAMRLTIELEDGRVAPFVFELEGANGSRGGALLRLLAELERTTLELLRLEAREAGIEAQEAEALARKYARKARLEGRRMAEAELAEAAASSPHCAFCRRRVMMVHEGVRLCSRHAEELGVRPRGKVT